MPSTTGLFRFRFKIVGDAVSGAGVGKATMVTRGKAKEEDGRSPSYGILHISSQPSHFLLFEPSIWANKNGGPSRPGPLRDRVLKGPQEESGRPDIAVGGTWRRSMTASEKCRKMFKVGGTRTQRPHSLPVRRDL
ncbi:hypothetical protein NL676_006181 [Syzygium grande]|nr:hypothetical protein NL676_006181 [Syzygium grande]